MHVVRRNNVATQGRGQPMLFAHGFGCDQQMWRFVAPSFIADHQVVLFDHVGSGRSDLALYDRQKYSSLNGYAADVVEICDDLDLRDVIFVGHSVSAIIGMLAAIERPELLSRLVLIGPSPCYINDAGYRGGFTRQDIDQLLELQDSNYLGWASMLASAVIGDPDRADLVTELTNSFCRTDPEITKQFAAVTFLSDNRADLARVNVPALIIQSEVDAIAPPEVGHYVHEHLRASELAMLPVTGHCPHLSAPERTVAVMKAFLQASLTSAA